MFEKILRFCNVDIELYSPNVSLQRNSRPLSAATALDLVRSCGAKLVIAFLVSFSLPARSDQQLSDNKFNIDAVDGPVLGSNRVVSMGGAFTALATSIDGAAWNPASYGSRTLWEQNWFEWDVSAGLMLAGVFSRNDLFNNGKGERIGAEDFFFYDTGLRLQFAKLGVGGLFRGQTFIVKAQDTTVNIDKGNIQFGGAWMFLDGELVAGVGARSLLMSVSLPEAGRTLVRFQGTGLEAGVVWRPEKWPIRLGASGRTAVRSQRVAQKGQEVTDPADEIEGFVLPNRVHMPWEAQVGFALQLGERPINLRWHVPPNPARTLLPQMRAVWCEREATQAKREAVKEGLDEAVVGECPRLRRRPRSGDWWSAEEQRREREEEIFDEEVEKERDDIRKTLRRRYEELPRYYWLISIDFLLVGSTLDGIGLDAFLDQEMRASGENITFSARLGAEVEPWAGRLKLRAGSYLEPSRNTGVPPRIHGTGGFDVRLFTWDLFGLIDPFSIRAGAMIDVSTRYVNWGVGIGMWH